MKYYLADKKMDEKINGIKRKIRLSMNGVVSENMTNNGIIYKTNFGVSILRIKEIASAYHQNHELAQRLWNLQIRETMIMATLLQPVEKFTFDDVREWSNALNQIEIIEQLTVNLLCKLDFAFRIIENWISDSNSWLQVTAFLLAGRMANKLSGEEINFIIEKSIEKSNTENFHLYKAIAFCLSRLCRIDSFTAGLIVEKLKTVEPSVSQQFISNEVRQEILFLADL
jgi:3-methyladenine DNA glycosylase AlkD